MITAQKFLIWIFSKQKSWSNNIVFYGGPYRDWMEAIVKLPKTLICGKMVRSGRAHKKFLHKMNLQTKVQEHIKII